MNDTRTKLINAAFTEIYQKGYQGASISAILKMSASPKGSLYHYFSSKKELALAVIKENIAVRLKDIWQPLQQTEDKIIDRLISTLKRTSDLDFSCGCPLNRLILEMSHIDEDFAIVLRELHQTCEGIIKEALDRAKSLGEIDIDDTRGLAIFILLIVEGSLGLSNGNNSEGFFASIHHLENYLTSLTKLKEYA